MKRLIAAHYLSAISRIAEKSLFSVKRFPVAVLLTAGLTVLLLSWKDAATIDNYRLLIFLANGIFVSLSAALLLEDIVDYLWQQAITVAITLLWGVYCFYLPDNYMDVGVVKTIELIAIGILSFLSIFFSSFLSRGRERAFLNFSVQVILQLTLAQFFGTVILAGLCFAAFAIKFLLGINVATDTVYYYLSILCLVLFATMYWIANIPDKTAKRVEEIPLNKHLKIFALYILTPIAAIYALILYAYLFKIIFTWELPRGLVSYMVSTLAVSGLLITSLLLPARLEGKSRFIVLWTRYFGLMMLPLFTLMAIGIFRRLGDYGITIHRVYLLLINLWFYGIYIYIFLTKARSIKWIPISFTALTLLASFGYWSVPNVTRHLLVAEVHKRLENQKIPSFDKATFEKFRGALGSGEWDKISSKIEYLNDRFGEESVRPFFSDSVDFSNFGKSDLLTFSRSKPSQAPSDKDVDYKSVQFYKYQNNDAIRLNGFNTFVSVDCRPSSGRSDKKMFDCAQEGWQLSIYAPSDSKTFTLPLREVVARIEDGTMRMEPVFQYDDYAIMVSNLQADHYSAADSISVSIFRCYLFYNHTP